MEVDISTISKHLGELKKYGIVDSYKERNRVYYVLKYRCILNFMHCIGEVTDQ